MKNGITVLSLCDGMSCGQAALQEAGIKINKYYASEIKNIGIKTAMYNYPNTIEIGDLTKISYSNGILNTEFGIFKEKFDIVIFGSPCQSFSIAMKTDKRVGLEDNERSGLFLQCYRILKEVNPKYFFMENVASMKNCDKDYITKLMGVSPYRINSNLVCGALRDRYYWTNIPRFEKPKDRNISLQSILIDGWTDRKKARSLLVSDSRPLTSPVKMFHRYYSTGFTTLIFKNEQHYKQCKEYYEEHYKGMKAKDIPTNETDVFNGVRYLNQIELERLQTIPEGYTKCLTRNEAADVLGDGWTRDIIVQFFKNIT